MVKGNVESAKQLAEKLAAVIREEKPSLLEGFLAIGSIMRSLGELYYDKEDLSPVKVFEDYRKSPNLPGALIIHADQVWEIVKIFTGFNVEVNQGEKDAAT